jgi:anti-repressor protein
VNNIINIGFENQTVYAIELHEAVGSTERFSAWFVRQLQFGFIQGIDYSNPLKVLRVQTEGSREVQREVEDYNLT